MMPDTVLTITIPEAKMADAAAGILKAKPIPIDDATGEPEYGPTEWAEELCKRYLRDLYRKGKRWTAAAGADIDAGVIT